MTLRNGQKISPRYFVSLVLYFNLLFDSNDFAVHCSGKKNMHFNLSGYATIYVDFSPSLHRLLRSTSLPSIRHRKHRLRAAWKERLDRKKTLRRKIISSFTSYTNVETQTTTNTYPSNAPSHVVQRDAYQSNTTPTMGQQLNNSEFLYLPTFKNNHNISFLHGKLKNNLQTASPSTSNFRYSYHTTRNSFRNVELPAIAQTGLRRASDVQPEKSEHTYPKVDANLTKVLRASGILRNFTEQLSIENMVLETDQILLPSKKQEDIFNESKNNSQKESISGGPVILHKDILQKRPDMTSLQKVFLASVGDMEEEIKCRCRGFTWFTNKEWVHDEHTKNSYRVLHFDDERQWIREDVCIPDDQRLCACSERSSLETVMCLRNPDGPVELSNLIVAHVKVVTCCHTIGPKLE